MPSLMKGETWKDALKPVRGKPRFEYPIWVEAKADEIRCHIRYVNGDVRYLSYAGKPLWNLQHFDTGFVEFFKAHPRITELDVGVEVNGNFNDSYRWTQSSSGIPQEKFDKKTRKTARQLYSGMVEFILFDLPEDTREYIHRRIAADSVRNALCESGLRVRRPARIMCRDEAEVMEAYRDFRDKGYEGAMGKTRDHKYERKRTFGWMKIKPNEDHDGRVTSFNEAVSLEGQPLGRVGSINVECADGSTASPSGIPHELGRELWENQAVYVGQWIEFYCMERDRAGGYRHPIYNRFREDKQ